MSAPRPTGSRLCLIHGNSLPEGADPVEGERVRIDAGGALPVEATDGGDIVGIPQARLRPIVPAHLVDHRANIRAACELGCDRVLALGSAGSLDKDLEVGPSICPEDFYAPEAAPSFYDDPRGHSVPGFDPDWRADRAQRLGVAAPGPSWIDGGVYAQTLGPRFETPAEVRALAERRRHRGHDARRRDASSPARRRWPTRRSARSTTSPTASATSRSRWTSTGRGRDRPPGRSSPTSTSCCRRSPGSSPAVEPRGHRRDARRRDGRRCGREDGADRGARARRSQPKPGDEVIDAAGLLLSPPMVNGHSHAAMTLFRGFGDDLPLMEWLETQIWPAEAKLEPDDVYWGTRLACLEMIRAGTTRFWDMYWHGARPRAAVVDSGHARDGEQPLIDRRAATRRRREPDAAPRARVARPDSPSSGRWSRRASARTRSTPSATESLRWIAELAAEREVPVQIHLSETEARGGRLRRRARHAPGRSTSTELGLLGRADGARARRLARRRRARAGRRARGDRRRPTRRRT